MITTIRQASIPTATGRDTLAVMARVIAPTVSKGVIIRRRSTVSLAEGLDLDRRAVRTMQRIRDAYAPGPVMLALPVRRQALALLPEHVRRILGESPEPFATASLEKRHALAHFEPRGVLISRGEDRADRRRFNEEALQNDCPMHSLAASFVETAEEETGRLLAKVPPRGILTWDIFAETWFRIVRRVVFGRGARDDHRLRDMLDTLRSHANWSFLSPKRRAFREAFLERVRRHLDRAEPGSLAAAAAMIPKTDRTAPEHQIPQWLFAFDPAGMTAFRALALLAAHPDYAERAAADGRSRSKPSEPLQLLRATTLEALRLWPTTPMILRETTREVEWESGVMPANTSVMIFAPFFHRDGTRLPFADRFAPEIWLEGAQRHGLEDWPLIPFSAGPAICPGRHVVQLVASVTLAAIISKRTPRLVDHDRLDPRRPLPGTLNHFTLRFELA